MATQTFDEASLQALVANATQSNDIVLENQKQGTPESEWMLNGDGDANIQGFATNISVNQGGTVDFKIATDSTHYRIEIYRLGYYGGDGARKVDTIDKTLASAQVQPHPIVDMSVGLIDCRQLVGLGELGRSRGRDLRRLHGQARPRGRHAGREHDPVHRPQRHQQQRHHLPDLRHDLGSLQCLGRRQPLLGQRAGRSRTT